MVPVRYNILFHYIIVVIHQYNCCIYKLSDRGIVEVFRSFILGKVAIQEKQRHPIQKANLQEINRTSSSVSS